MKTLEQDLKKKEFKNAYLLYGEETYLINQYKKKLKLALLEDSDDMNFHYFEGDKAIPEKIIDVAETLPFFAQRRVILVEDAPFFTKGNEKMEEYLKDIAPTTFFIFVERKVDQRMKLVKTINKVGRCCEFPKANENLIKMWVMGRIKKENKQITQRAYESFIERTDSNMENMNMELEKLLSYTMHKDAIDLEDVEEICVGQVIGKIFEMIDAISMKRQDVALKKYYDLLELKEPPAKILSLIVQQWNMMLLVKGMNSEQASRQSMADAIKRRDFVVRKLLDIAKRYTMDELKDAVTLGVSTEEAFKTGKMDMQLGIEVYIMELSKKR